MPRQETPEALCLGAWPGEVALRPGPLIVSSLGADPPDRSIHFHLSLMSFVDGEARALSHLPSPEEVDVVFGLAKQLDTKSLTLLRGEGRDHGLVLEGRGELGTTSAADAAGKPIRLHLPEGDHENALRRLIDDSVNLLTENELNQRRIDDGLAPLNLLWPWGHGVRSAVPNLALGRGERATVESASFRLAGLARLAGDFHADRAPLGRGLATKFRALADRLLGRTLSIAVLDAFAELAPEAEEERHWLAREIDRELLQPLLDRAATESIRIALLAPRKNGDGLALVAEPPVDRGGRWPFDDRALEERLVVRQDLDAIVREAATL